MGSPVIVIIIEIIVYINNHLIRAGNLDARFRIMEPDDPVGICIIFVTILLLSVDRIIRQLVTVSAAIIFVDISSVGRYRHVRCVALHDHYFFLLRLLGFFLNHCRRFPCRIGINIIPFLSETEQRHSYQQNRK
jgi:hypothetical protein